MCHNISTHNPTAKSMPTSGWKLHDFLGILGGGVKKGISNNFSSLKRHTFSTSTKGGAAEHYYVIGVH
jgi:hypothetical protein